jgi:hypothetical protein
VNFTFELFLEALCIIATHGFDRIKDDLTSRMNLLFKHIFEVMNGQSNSNEGKAAHEITISGGGSVPHSTHSPKNTSERKAKAINEDFGRRKVYKNGSEVFLTSNRSGASSKSSRARKRSTNSKKSRNKRRSSHKKRGRRGVSEYNSFKLPMKSKDNSLPALTAIYGGNSLDISKKAN